MKILAIQYHGAPVRIMKTIMHLMIMGYAILGIIAITKIREIMRDIDAVEIMKQTQLVDMVMR